MSEREGEIVMKENSIDNLRQLEIRTRLEQPVEQPRIVGIDRKSFSAHIMQSDERDIRGF